MLKGSPPSINHIFLEIGYSVNSDCPAYLLSNLLGTLLAITTFVAFSPLGSILKEDVEFDRIAIVLVALDNGSVAFGWLMMALMCSRSCLKSVSTSESTNQLLNWAKEMKVCWVYKVQQDSMIGEHFSSTPRWVLWLLLFIIFIHISSLGSYFLQVQ